MQSGSQEPMFVVWPPVFIRDRYDACAYVLQLFEFGHSFQRLLLPFFVCCDFLDSTHTNPCFAFSLFEHHLLDLSAFTNKLTRTSLVHFFCFYQSHESRRFAFPLFFAPSGQFCRHVCCCVPLADCVCAPPVFCIRVSYDARAYFRWFYEFGHSFQRLLLPSFICCMFCFFTTLRPSLELTWFERIRQQTYTNKPGTILFVASISITQTKVFCFSTTFHPSLESIRTNELTRAILARAHS